MLFVLMRLAELENNLPDEAVEGTTAEWQEWSSAVQKLMVSAPVYLSLSLIITDDHHAKQC